MSGVIPGPPRGRGRAVARTLWALQGEAEGGLSVSALLALVRDVVFLLKDLAVDPRVPRREKILAGVAAAYLASPIDLVPDVVPVLGQIDDLWVLGMAIRRFLSVAGYDLIYELWRGTDEGLAMVLTLAGVQE